MDYKAELIRLKEYLQTEIQFINDDDSVPDKFARQANKNTLEKVNQILKRGEAEPTNEDIGLHLQRVTAPLLWKDVVDDFYVEHDKQISNGEYKGKMILVFRDWLEQNYQVPERNGR